MFTSGIVSRVRFWLIASFGSGWKHAGENLADVLQRRTPSLQPLIQMCDALSRNVHSLGISAQKASAHLSAALLTTAEFPLLSCPENLAIRA